MESWLRRVQSGFTVSCSQKGDFRATAADAEAANSGRVWEDRVCMEYIYVRDREVVYYMGNKM